MSNQKNWHATIADQWGIYAPPIIPSEEEVRLIKRHLKKGQRTLILGSTPELRDLAHSLGHEVMLADVSMKMMLELRNLMKCKGENEKWMKADWLTMPLKYGYFDVVLGDFVLCNIPVESQEFFFRKIHSLLKPGGLFIHRHLFLRRKRTLGEISRCFEGKVSKKLENALIFDANILTYDATTFEISTKKARKIISRNKGLLKAHSKYYKGDKTWWLTPLERVKYMIKPFFKIIDVEYAKDHPYKGECPIYVLKK